MSTRFSSPSDSTFELELSRGNIFKMGFINKFGRNPDVTTTEDIWGRGGLFVPPTTAGIVRFVSTSASDTALGIGGRTLTIIGLDGSYNEISEVITLNGLTNVPTTNQYIHINRAFITTAGSSGSLIGMVTGTSATAGNPVLTFVNDGDNESSNSVYLMPVGYTGYLTHVHLCGHTSANNNQSCNVDLQIRPFGGVFNTRTHFSLSQASIGAYTKEFMIPLQVPQKAYVKMKCMSVSGGTWDISTDYTLILIAN